ncbi:class I adenylate-forming enzyme family protein [Frankia sp. ACN1ag]|uniref:class I adenylate-forming enzyme family protein n=1 Tax=Frankia sp. ACN1ag TaxID=102891 RepID=UPI0006DCEDE8|nr:AMP-binding protein [Frankia sp. ACN1ag]
MTSVSSEQPAAGGLAATEAVDLARAAERWPWLLTAPTVDGLVARRAQATPDAPMLIDEHDARLTFAEFDAKVDRVAAALAGEGVTAGTRVAWQLPTRISTLLVMIALRRLGAVQAPVIPIYREREVGAALAAVDAEVFLVPGTWRGTDYTAIARAVAAAGGPAPRLLEIGHDAPEADPPGAGARPDHRPDEVRWIYFTSGSTGIPKGARHSDGTLLATAVSFAGLSGLGRAAGEVGAVGYPVAHVGGIQYLIAALAAGFPILLLEAFIPDQAVELFRRHGVTATGGSTPFYTALLDLAAARPGERLIPTLRSLKGGGAPCPPHLVGEVDRVLGAVLAHDYGMTEVPMVAVAAIADPPDVLAATDGRPVPVNRLRFVDEGGAALAPGAVGEVQVSGHGVCHGYTDPEATRAAFTADGWFRTGDLGRLVPSGHIEIVGRLKDLIIRKGENIAPQEIEALLGRHPDVAEVAVIGLPDPDRGERVCAVVVARPGRPVPSLAQLSAWLREAGLMRQKLPEQLELIDIMPRTGLGKVAKAQLRARYEPREP